MAFGEGRPREISSASSRARSVEQQLRVEAGADLAGEDEVVALEIADEQRAQADPAALRVGEPADHELLRASHFIFSQCGERRCS